MLISFVGGHRSSLLGLLLLLCFLIMGHLASSFLSFRDHGNALLFGQQLLFRCSLINLGIASIASIGGLN
jgi:uncharacterized membrane protein